MHWGFFCHGERYISLDQLLSSFMGNLAQAEIYILISWAHRKHTRRLFRW